MYSLYSLQLLALFTLFFFASAVNELKCYICLDHQLYGSKVDYAPFL